jgi:putative chitinase
MAQGDQQLSIQNGVVIVVTDNGNGTFNTDSIGPGSFTDPSTFVATDVSAKAQAVRDFCAAQWTPQVIAAFKTANPYVAPDPDIALQQSIRANARRQALVNAIRSSTDAHRFSHHRSFTMLSKAFFDSVRASLFGGSLSNSQVSALVAIDEAWQEYGNGHIDAEAYTFATIYNEVGRELLPKPENLNYSAKRLLQVFPSKFKSLSQAQAYAFHPQMLANRVYAGILGNGDEGSGDGWTYRGHGYQTTGRAHFTTFGELLNVDLVRHPEILDESVELAASALIIGMVRGLYTGKSFETYLDGKDEPDAEDLREFVNARRIVNGTFNARAIAEYALKFERALQQHAA